MCGRSTSDFAPSPKKPPAHDAWLGLISHGGLDGGSASRYKNEAQTRYSLHHPFLLGVSMVGRNQYGYINPTFLGSPWWGEINLVRSGCGGNEKKMEENW